MEQDLILYHIPYHTLTSTTIFITLFVSHLSLIKVAGDVFNGVFPRDVLDEI